MSEEMGRVTAMVPEGLKRALMAALALKGLRFKRWLEAKMKEEVERD